MKNIYYIGGSPCCGKSTIAEMIVQKYNFEYFKVDDFLETNINKAAKLGKPFSSSVTKMSLDDIWLRDPQVQNSEEIELYKEMFDFLLEDLNNFSDNIPIVSEGAAFLPKLINEIGVEKSKYICIVPTNKFQFDKYSQRTWVKDYLKGCSNIDLAFENWMKRDNLFANTVLKDAKDLGYSTIVVDGKTSIDENFKLVEKIFNLSI